MPSGYVSATMTSMTWHGERLWDVGVLQRVRHLSRVAHASAIL